VHACTHAYMHARTCTYNYTQYNYTQYGHVDSVMHAYKALA